MLGGFWDVAKRLLRAVRKTLDLETWSVFEAATGSVRGEPDTLILLGTWVT